MSVRKTSARLGVAAAAVAGLVLTVLAPANADTKPGDPGVAGSYALNTQDPTTASIIGVGSDTIQWVDDQLAKDYDNSTPTPTHAWADFSACLGNTSAGAPGLGDNPDGSGFPCGATSDGTQAGVKREEHVVDPSVPTGQNHFLPSGSGDGRTLLRTPSDPLFNNVAYARSSGPLNSLDNQNGELALPFAVDKIVVVTHPGGPAPASLTGPQILKIFNGTYTNWNQVGGKNAQIHPYMPKNGSSTLNAFESFLAALDGQTSAPGSDSDPGSHHAAHQTWQGPGVTITNANWNTGTANVEEHDPSVVIADANAIEPFSYARAQLANGQSKTVRIEGGWSADRELYHVVRGQPIQNGPTPFVYGNDTGLLEALFSPTGWVCTNSTAQTDIANAGFWPLLAGTNPGNCGVANTGTLDTITPGVSHGVDEGDVTSTTAQYFSGAVHITVTDTADASVTPTGTVQVVAADPATGGITPKPAAFHTTVALDSNGNATVKVPTTVTGPKVFDVAYLPTSFGANGQAGHEALGSSYAQTKPVKMPTSKVATTVKATPKPATLLNARATSKVTVTVKPASGSAKPTGTVSLMRGTKKVGSGTLRGGTVTITVHGSSLAVGRNTLTAKYAATGSFQAPSKAPTFTITRKK